MVVETRWLEGASDVNKHTREERAHNAFEKVLAAAREDQVEFTVAVDENGEGGGGGSAARITIGGCGVHDAEGLEAAGGGVPLGRRRGGCWRCCCRHDALLCSSERMCVPQKHTPRQRPGGMRERSRDWLQLKRSCRVEGSLSSFVGCPEEFALAGGQVVFSLEDQLTESSEVSVVELFKSAIG